MRIAIYNTKNGKIVRRFDAPADQIDIQLEPDEEFYLNCPAEATHVIDNELRIVETPPPPREELLRLMRAERNRRLALCDWTQMPDCPLSDGRRAWQAYRQALRDLPATCDPDNPIWPAPPDLVNG